MSKDITMCHPRLQELANELIQKCDEQGLKIKLTECFRSVAEQDFLYAKGRTVAGKKVTNAKGSSMSSMHQWGIAFDICRNDGTGAYNDSDGFFNKVSVIGKCLGLEWGGDWKSIKDKPHYQLPDWGSTPIKLKQQYGTIDKFKETWGITERVQASKIVETSKPVQEQIIQPIINLHLRDLQKAITDDKISILKADGIYGKLTDSAIKKIVIRQGSYGNVVSWVQCRIGATIDGKAGKRTRDAIIAYQYSHGISHDGVAGYNTIKTILRQYGVNC